MACINEVQQLLAIQQELARFKAKTKEICTRMKALAMELASLARDEEEELLQLDVVGENHPAKDAPQVFDESPESNTCIKSKGRDGNGQEYAREGLDTVPCEQLGPSNGLLGKSISSIHGKSTFNVQEWQQDNVQPSSDEMCRLIAASWLCEQAKGGEQCLDLELRHGCASLVVCFPIAGNRAVYFDELLHCPSSGFSVISPANLQQVLGVLLKGIKDAPNVAEKVCGAIYYLAQGFEDVESSSSDLTLYLTEIIASLIATADRTDTTEIKLWSSAYETLKKVQGCCLLVFDPGILGAGQSTLQPKSLVFMFAWLVENLAASVVKFVFDPGGIAVNTRDLQLDSSEGSTAMDVENTYPQEATDADMDEWFEKLIPTSTAQQEQQENPGWKCANSFCFIVFDPGGTLPVSPGLLPVSHTIHDLEAVRAVFDPGGKIISSYIGPSPPEPGAVTDMDELGSADSRPSGTCWLGSVCFSGK